jgi:alpha-tubulin suppressor-like RCC1 family protein
MQHQQQPLSNGNDADSQVVKKGYTEFFSWGNDEDGQLGHGHDGIDRKKIFNLPKSLSFEVIITHVSCGYGHTSFISNQGYVFSFGSNSDGQLGINDQALSMSTAPLLVSELV